MGWERQLKLKTLVFEGIWEVRERPMAISKERNFHFNIRQ